MESERWPKALKYFVEMVEKYYIDTSIWMDLLEDRKGYNHQPLGDYALKLFTFIKAKKYKLIISDLFFIIL